MKPSNPGKMSASLFLNMPLFIQQRGGSSFLKLSMDVQEAAKAGIPGDSLLHCGLETKPNLK